MVVPRDRLRMTTREVDDLLSTERVMRLATVGEDGKPHVVPLWFVWDGTRFWVNNLNRSKRTRDLESGRPVSFVVDTGEHYGELRGVKGDVEPRFIDDEVEDTVDVRRAFAAKYLGTTEPAPLMPSHTWITLTPIGELTSWDFRKLGG